MSMLMSKASPVIDHDLAASASQYTIPAGLFGLYCSFSSSWIIYPWMFTASVSTGMICQGQCTGGHFIPTRRDDSKSKLFLMDYLLKCQHRLAMYWSQ